MNTDDQEQLDKMMTASEATVDLSKLEKREHRWLQRGRFLGCHCHPGIGTRLPDEVNLVGVNGGEPVFSKA
jgi:hypothetical protein